MRWILGNLDGEATLSRRDRSRPGPAPPAWPEALLRRLSGVATLLRALAHEGDVVWTPRPVSAARVPVVEGLPHVELRSGALPERVSRVLPWCVTGAEPTGGEAPPAEADDGSLAGRLWNLPRPDPDVVARVAHRGFVLEWARRAGVALPGARLVHSLEELRAHLAAGGASASPDGRWVLKPPFSAAGRGHVREPAGDASAWEVRVARLCAAYGGLLFEPWMHRRLDLGCCALIDDEGVDVLGIHELVVDARGRFRGIELARDGSPPPGATPSECARLLEVTARAGEALARAGYRGPFGVDAFRHERADGSSALHALSEVNPRLTFGFVARVLVERLADARGCRADERLRLLLAGRLASGPDDLVLLEPGPDARAASAAWMVRVARC